MISYGGELTNIALAFVKSASGEEFVVEMDSMMEAYARVIPY